MDIIVSENKMKQHYEANFHLLQDTSFPQEINQESTVKKRRNLTYHMKYQKYQTKSYQPVMKIM